MKFFTIGYGGRTPASFVELLSSHGVLAIADVRIHPERASMGSYVRAKTADKGIERLLTERGIAYYSILELGNLLRDLDDWEAAYTQLLDASGELLVKRLHFLPVPYCLMCAEKHVAKCHRRMIANYLVRTRGWTVEHIE
jgi:uncharacterized protein (DUF488 family)